MLLEGVEKDLTSQVLSEFQDIANIWRIERTSVSVVIFYEKESVKVANEENGITKKIKDIYLSNIKLVDSIRLFKEEYIIFDTKETLDEKYGDNLYYYFR